jgi:Peptidase family S41
MSEKIYAFLLRLYPAAFRKMYGEDVMQLVRDRLRDETGFVNRLRLWSDLVVDLAMSLPSEYRNAQPILSATQSSSDGVPVFHVLEERPIGPGTLFAAVICFLAVLGTLSLLMKQGRRPNADRTMQGAAAQQTRWAASPGASPRLGRNEGQAIVAVAQQPLDPTQIAPASASPQRVTPALDAVERRRVIEAAGANLKQHYFDANRASMIANALLAHENNGDNKALMDGASFAQALTRQMREVGQDVDLKVEYSARVLPDHPPAPDLAQYHASLLQNNCLFQKVTMQPHAIGYVQLDGFADLSVCRPAAAKTMASLNHAKAIIFDLRNNRGGDPAMVAFMAAYLFNHPENWYNPRGDTPATTQSPVAGNRLADKPVYVLTSGITWSGAEQFAYDLKMLKRATLVGQTTGGGAHAGVFHRLDDHFGMGIPEVHVVNPFGKNDWEGTGVAPDVNVPASGALDAAVKLAQRKSR